MLKILPELYGVKFFTALAGRGIKELKRIRNTDLLCSNIQQTKEKTRDFSFV